RRALVRPLRRRVKATVRPLCDIREMSKRAKLLESVRNNRGDTRFSDLQLLLEQHGFRLARITGSHHIYRRADGRMCNIQKTRDGMAKRYQVDQVLEAIDAAS